MSGIDETYALRCLWRLLSVEGLSGHERMVAAVVREELRAAGVPARWMRHDQAHRRLEPAGQVGNLIVRLPGTVRGPALAFLGHLDTVPLVRGVQPVRRGRRIVPQGRTALGADDRTAVACLVTVIRTLVQERIPHGPLTFVFTVSEETGLSGVRHLRRRDLGRPIMAFNIDGGPPGEIQIGAIGAQHWEARIEGLAAHAGMHPERGVSAVAVAAEAIAALRAGGWFGRVVKGRRRGTANVGVIEGGRATNEVADRTIVRGECRSHDPRFLEHLVATYHRTFAKAARRVRNEAGRTGRVRFRVYHRYPSFRLPADAPPIAYFRSTAEALGLKVSTLISDGGLDANIMTVVHGIPTVTMGAGAHHPHSLKEYADIAEFLTACRLCLALATGGRSVTGGEPLPSG